MRKIKKNWSKFEERMNKLKLLPTQDCEAGYGPVSSICGIGVWILDRFNLKFQTSRNKCIYGYIKSKYWSAS